MTTNPVPSSDALASGAPKSALAAQEVIRPLVPAETRGWSAGARVLFRWLAAYFVLYLAPFPLVFLSSISGGPWRRVVVRIGAALGLPITVFPNGSGDTTYNYVEVLTLAVMATLAALVWTVVDGRRADYRRLHQWLRLYVRFALAAAMITYGAIKVIQSQFPPPGPERLLQPLGQFSPMGLLWTFMGASRAYNVYAGLGEMAGGLLLGFGPTVLLGALVSAAVLSNVVMLNFSYDVPVKLYSLHLLALALFLAAPDARRLLDFFVRARATAPAPPGIHLSRPWLRRVTAVLGPAIVIVYAAVWLSMANRGRHTWGDLAPRPPLYGLWDVDELTIDGKVRPPLVTDRERWRRLIFTRPGSLGVQYMDDSRERYALELDAARHVLTLTNRDTQKVWPLSYHEPSPGRLVLDGTLDGHSTQARLHVVPESEFLLTGRGFHWINEYPFNR